jgi:hypothetical protein
VATTHIVQTMFTNVVNAEESSVNVPDVAVITVKERIIFGAATRMIMNLAGQKKNSICQFQISK